MLLGDFTTGEAQCPDSEGLANDADPCGANLVKNVRVVFGEPCGGTLINWLDMTIFVPL